MHPPPSAIDFWFDFSSPYAYIASEWLAPLAARHGREVVWHPILLGVTFQAAELKSPVSHPLKREYTLLDFERSARFAGVPYALPARFPIPTQNAARVFWWLQSSDPARATAWVRHAYAALFVRGVDLSDAAALRSVATDFGLDGDTAEAAWSDPRWKAELKSACDDAVSQGVFGAPFFRIDGEPFWGNDRRAIIEQRLAGQADRPVAQDDRTARATA